MAPEENDIQKKTVGQPNTRWVLPVTLFVIVTGIIITVVVMLNPKGGCGIPPSDEDTLHDPCASVIDIDMARQLFRNYIERSQNQENEVYLAFSVNKCQFRVMQDILSNPKAVATRFYPGIDNENEEVYALCGVDIQGNDISSKVLLTDGYLAGLCPRYCDEYSALLRGDPKPVIQFEFGQTIAADDARQLILAFYQEGEQTEGAVNAFCIPKEHYAVMKSIAEQFTAYEGFRIYHAKGADSLSAMILCAFDSNNKDYTDVVYVVTPVRAGLCPPYCDDKSFIY
ncbi:MAG: hypothetical protein R6V49_04325, partial [Bacteroidales bacterium]